VRQFQQQVKFARRQFQRRPGQAGPVAARLDLQLAEIPHLAGLARVAAQHGAHARQQFGGDEGFDDEVVGAAVQAGEPVVERGARRDDDDRQRDASATSARQQVQAGAVRQRQVKQGAVGEGARRVGHPAQPLAADALDLEGLLERESEVEVILDDEYMHATILRAASLRLAKEPQVGALRDSGCCCALARYSRPRRLSTR